MNNIIDFFDSFTSFPQLSFLKPLFIGVVLLVSINLTFQFIFSFFGRFFK